MKISDATRIEEIRTLLKKASFETRKLSAEALKKSGSRGLKIAKGREHGRRYRMTKSLAESMDMLADLMWELPGIKWP